MTIAGRELPLSHVREGVHAQHVTVNLVAQHVKQLFGSCQVVLLSDPPERLDTIALPLFCCKSFALMV